jgi:hypothetical protein
VDVINVESVRGIHARFLRAQDKLLTTDTERAGQFAAEHVEQHSDFVARSGGRSMKKATQHRVLRLKNGRIVRIRSPKHYASYIEYGTRAHGPVRARALRFVIGGRVIFARRVRGIRPRKFLYKATWAAGRNLETSLAQGMARLAREF